METPNYNTNDFNELDDLRQQINDLKNKVDQQGLLNENLVKKTVQGKMKGLHHTLFWYCLIVGLFVPFIILDFIQSGFSWPFIIFTILIFAGSFIAEYFVNRMNISHMADDLVGTARKLLKMKENRKKQLTIGICALAIWIPWYFFELYKSFQLGTYGNGSITYFLILMGISITIGGGIGFVIGYSFYRKMQRTNDEMINQINELTHEQ